MATSWAEQTASGKWQARYRTDDGKRHGAGSWATKKQAQDAAAVALAGHDPSDNPAFRDVAADWMKTRGRVAASTRKSNETHLNARLNPRLGDKPVKSITAETMEDFVTDLIEDGYSPNSIGHTMATAKMIFDRAIRRGLISINPAKGIPLPSPGRSPDRYITRDQFNAITRSLPHTGYSRRVAEILVSTGLRLGELRALHWEDVDFSNDLIQVTRAYNESTRQIKDVKNHQNRSVPISPMARTALHEARHEGNYPGTPAVGVEYIDKPLPVSGLIFTSQGNRPFSADVVRREWSASCRLATVNGQPVGSVRLQDLRHTAASWMMQDGISLETVKQFLGHEAIRTTERYARFGAMDWTEAKKILTTREPGLRDAYSEHLAMNPKEQENP
ncbi:tyrosine-type recombinase/integrase [Corynebacterium sputi]|uniref:tyrosine-type recombinase/integrase n=1 Tax=Corynebacterium sputi TaxID=489915 RepID=UPI00040F7027|nr:tyrosine-type recombinase/integrase [Corynebacterium sputi]